MSKLHTHASVGQGESYDLESLRDTLLPASVWKEGVFASDMDQTMFLNDMGALVFIEYLQNPAFYAMSTDELRRIILPSDTEWFFEQGAAGQIEGVSSEGCHEALLLAEEIVKNFDALRASMQQTRHTPDRSQLMAFIQKICALDSKLIHLKNQHPDPAVSNTLAKAFSRYRLFGGQEASVIDRLTTAVMSLAHDHPERVLPIQAGDSKHAEVDRLIRVNGSVHGLLDRVIEDGAEGYAVTATPFEIATTAIRSSIYSHIIPHDRILATKLMLNPEKTHLAGGLDGEMMAGIRKAQLLAQIEADTNRKIMLVLGDLPGSDAAMGAMALRNNGVFVVTHHPQQLEETHDGFDRYLKRLMGNNDVEHAQDRILYIPAHPLGQS